MLTVRKTHQTPICYLPRMGKDWRPSIPSLAPAEATSR
jgi:hypothetical protein